MKIKYLALLLGLSCSSFLSAQIVVDQWLFNDTAGTLMPDLTNSGTNSTAWNTTPPGFTVGGGLLNMSGESTIAATAAYASPVTATGLYSFEVTFDAWDHSGWADTGVKNFTVGLADSTGNFIGRVYLQWNSGNSTNIIAQTNTGGLTTFNTLASNLGTTSSTTPQTVVVDVDFDNDTVTYFLNGTEKNTHTGFTGTDIDSIVIGRFGNSGAGWDNTDPNVVSIDSITLTQVPEPGTVAFFMGLVALGAIQVRRFRGRSRA